MVSIQVKYPSCQVEWATSEKETATHLSSSIGWTVDIISHAGNHGDLHPCTIGRSEKNRPTMCVDTYASGGKGRGEGFFNIIQPCLSKLFRTHL